MGFAADSAPGFEWLVGFGMVCCGVCCFLDCGGFGCLRVWV